MSPKSFTAPHPPIENLGFYDTFMTQLKSDWPVCKIVDYSPGGALRVHISVICDKAEKMMFSLLNICPMAELSHEIRANY